MEEINLGTSDLVSPKRNPPGKFVSSSQRTMIANIYENMMITSPNLKYKERIAAIGKQVGIGRITIINSIAEFKKTRKSKSPNKKRPRMNILEKTSEEDVLAIRKKVHEFWLRKEIPNMVRILTAVNEDPELPTFGRTTLYRLLKRVEFKSIVRSRDSALIENPRIIRWRQQYIEKIRRFRDEGRRIYYLDGTWITAGDCQKKLWADTSVFSPRNAAERGLSTGIPSTANRGKRLIIGHIGSSDGFLPAALLCFESKKDSADYHGEMNGNSFFDWFKSFLPNLQDRSIIVMDNAPYHSVRLEKFPTTAWNKPDISKWLENKGENLEPRYTKPQLLALVKKYQLSQNNYVIDEYAKQFGHTVVRLPPYHCELNPIELAWAKVKHFIRERNTSYKLADVRQLVDRAIRDVSVEMWQNFIRHAIKEEDRFWEIDNEVASTFNEVNNSMSDDSDNT